MTGRLAILACSGALPVALAAEHSDALCIGLTGIPNDLGSRAHEFQLEKLGAIWEFLHSEGVDQIVFAGALARPTLDPSMFDDGMRVTVPRLMTAMAGGDDGLLRFVITIFEEQGFAVKGAHELMPELTAEHDLAVGPDPSELDIADIARGQSILAALSPLDVGQGCVVAGGQCLGIETVQGTDALLRYVSETPEALKRGAKGVFVKAAKAGQDLRIDMPSVGPETVASAAKAGLAGLTIEPGRVMILEREKTLQTAVQAGIFLRAMAV